MSFFTTTAKLHHKTALPDNTTLSQALKTLQNHDLLLRLDPELAHYETLPSASDSPHTKRYKVTDKMHALPAGLWDSTVTFECELTNTEQGVSWVIKAPLGLVQRTEWRIMTIGEEKDLHGSRNEEYEEGWCLVEDVEIKANRLVVGIVKGKCEENWRGIHGRFVGHLQEEIQKSDA